MPTVRRFHSFSVPHASLTARVSISVQENEPESVVQASRNAAWDDARPLLEAAYEQIQSGPLPPEDPHPLLVAAQQIAASGQRVACVVCSQAGSELAYTVRNDPS